MFEKILLAVDGSEHAAKALDVTAQLAKIHGSKVLVFHVHEFIPGGRGGAVSMEAPEASHSLVAADVAKLRETGVDAEGRADAASQGRTAPDIVDAAHGFGADLIVVGSRGLSEFSGLLLGSVATKVVHHADIPVLIVR